MAHRLPGRVSWAHRHPPDPVCPAAVILRPVPAAIAHVRTHHASLCQTRARNGIHPPILGRHDAAGQHIQKLGPLLAPCRRQPGLLDVSAVRRRGRAIEPLHHLLGPRVVRDRRIRQSVHAPCAAQSPQQRRHGAGHPARLGVWARDVPQLHVRSGGVGRDSVGGVELERGHLPGGGVGANGAVGAQEGGPVQARVWRGLCQEELCHDPWDMVIYIKGNSFVDMALLLLLLLMLFFVVYRIPYPIQPQPPSFLLLFHSSLKCLPPPPHKVAALPNSERRETDGIGVGGRCGVE